ncbi:unnamed protein product, partial [Pylaiella littoralis]
DSPQARVNPQTSVNVSTIFKKHTIRTTRGTTPAIVRQESRDFLSPDVDEDTRANIRRLEVTGAVTPWRQPI